MDSIGDANAAFFHAAVKQKRIQCEDSDWLENSIYISHSGEEYYANLFGQDPIVQ